jgi:hypothetical protein
VAAGGRGRGVREPFDGVPHFEGGKLGLSVETADEASS